MDKFYKTASSDRYQLLKDSAHSMRKMPTEAEEHLWQHIRGSQLGVKFRRQHPISDYIADFICLPEKLIIEIDGSVHQNIENIEHDKVRDEWLEHLGYRTIRFTNRQIFTELDSVLTIIKQNINKK